MAYYVLIDGEQAGPFEPETVAAMIARGEISPATLVWTAGMDDWAPAAEAPELASMFESASAPVAATPAPHPARAARTANQPLDIGRAYGSVLEGFKRQPAPALLVALIYNLVSLLLFQTGFASALTFDDSGEAASVDVDPRMLLIGLAAMLLVVPILYGGVAALMLDLVRDDRMRIGKLFSGASRALPLVIFGVLYMAGFAIGMMLLVVPAIFVGVAFALTPFIVMESSLGAIAAMKDSFRAVMGLGWWRCFLALAAVLLAMLVATSLIQGLFGAFANAQSAGFALAGYLVALAVNMLFTVFLHGTLAAMYEQARENRERAQS